jgi:hypothetical protein
MAIVMGKKNLITLIAKVVHSVNAGSWINMGLEDQEINLEELPNPGCRKRREELVTMVVEGVHTGEEIIELLERRCKKKCSQAEGLKGYDLEYCFEERHMYIEKWTSYNDSIDYIRAMWKAFGGLEDGAESELERLEQKIRRVKEE